MSTNYRQARQDDSSDDEGPSKRVKHNDDDGEGVAPARPAAPAATGSKKGNNLWAEVVQEEELLIRSSGMEVNDFRKKGSSFVKIRRGAESYVVPAAKLEENAAALEAGEDMEKDVVQLPRAAAPSDDPFGDSAADLGEVEAFGVGPSSGRGGASGRGGWQPRGGGGGRGGVRGVRGGWMKRGDHQQGGGAPRPEGAGAGGDEEMEQGDGGDVPDGGHRGGRGRGGGAGRGGRGFVPRGRGAWRGATDDGRKRRWNDHGHAHAKDPAALMEHGYSLAGLLATEFQEGLSTQELGEAISKALGERESDTVVKIVVAVGEQKALELFEATKKAEQEGGVKVADGSRRRTPGGVFILLFKSDVDVDPDVKGSIFAESMAAARKFAKARKRKAPNTTNVGRDLDELQAMLEAKKRELEEAGEKKDSPPEEGEATPSPAGVVAEGEEELDYTEEDDDDSSPGPERME